MTDGKNTPGQPPVIGATGPDLLPWGQGARDDDPVEQRIAGLFARLESPPDTDPRRLSRMRARLDAAVRPRSVASSARRSRVWVWALTGLLLLLGSGVVVAARGWAPRWISLRALAPRAQVASRPARPRKVQPMVAEPGTEPVPEPVPILAIQGPQVPVPANQPLLQQPSGQQQRPAMAVASPGVRSRAEVAPPSEAALLETAVARLRRDRDAAGTLQILDRYNARFARGVLRGEATRLRVDALLLTEDRAAALSLLESLSLSSGARDVELALIRGELLAARGDCRRALVDFDRVTATTAASALRRRAQTGRNDCEMHLGQPASAPP